MEFVQFVVENKMEDKRRVLARGEKMANIIIGFIFVGLGAWGVVGHWWGFLDFLRVIIPLSLVGVGVIAVLAGVRSR